MTLQKYMEEKGISNYKLSKKANISQATISEFLNNKRGVKLKTACKIADALEISLDKLREMIEGDRKHENNKGRN